MKTKNSQLIKRHSIAERPPWVIDRSLLILLCAILLLTLGIAIPVF